MSLFKKDKSKKEHAAQRREGLSVQEERKHLLTPKSDFFIREAYKTLRTNVSFALSSEEGCKVITVTSAQQGEGKSITTLNLAISKAMTDRKVLVIDCDLRRPKVSRLLQMSGKVGLSNLIINTKLLSEAILPTEIKGLDVILSGSIPPNPSELLSSPQMEQLLEKLRESYDYIFLDSPPVNMVTDAVVLAPKCDGVLLLVRANRSERGSVIHAVEQLEYSKAKILGFILNGVDMENLHYGYKKYGYGRYSRNGYRRYGYGHGYGYGYGYGYSSRHGYGYGYSSSMPHSFVPEQTEEPEAKEQ